ncbi:unnamed protein product [Schistosoma rodhaini]|uniref:Uncharacterized protein n=1 Tax=Schistosoma rodhaini TaxID=6188 RepID=A0A183QMU9_9TREM|nr:unnamed protein product [Schistosoma rodhaini]
MDVSADKSPLIQPEDTSNKPSLPSITVIKPKHPRRYKLLPKDKLRFPKNDTSNQLWRTGDYTKHMPLINVNCDDDSEEFDGALFQKVANKGLCDYLKNDRLSSHNRSNLTNSHTYDDWDLHLSTPVQRRTQICCPFSCTLS